MTHDELLTKIDASGFVRDKDYVWSLDGPAVKKANAALRAVVELHKPSPIPDWVPTEDKLMCWCAHVYPCPTVKAIEKEFA